MRWSFALVLVLPSAACAQPNPFQDKLDTLDYIKSLQAPDGGFYLTAPDPKSETKPVPSLRATSAALHAWTNLGAYRDGKKPPNLDKHAKFVLSCYDPKTGGFAEPGGKPDVATTSAGVVAAMELTIPKKEFAKAMDYLKDNAKTFEDVRIAAAAVDAWDVVSCPFKLDKWMDIADDYGEEQTKAIKDAKDGGTRILGSLVEFYIRLGRSTFGPSVTGKRADLNQIAGDLLRKGQREDGGFGKAGEKVSDIESTYRVVHAFRLVWGKPKDTKKLREFVESHRNKDGGYAMKPGDKSSMDGVYFCAAVLKWLDEIEAAR